MDRPRRRLALLLEYDGAGYAGSQLQANGPTVQAELEAAIQAMTGAFARAAFAGRTDAGVHALGQVATFDTEASYPPEAFIGGLNTRLPWTIAVRAVREVGLEFDPRRHALGRRYRYRIVTSPVRTPLLRERAWQVKAALDEATMRQAAALLLGQHDFAAFAPPEASRGGTRREMRAAELYRDGRVLVLELEANAFLTHQVRRTAGALVEVGAGRRTVSDFARLLHGARPGACGFAAPPHGLCLLAVRYDPPLFGEDREQSTSYENL